MRNWKTIAASAAFVLLLAPAHAFAEIFFGGAIAPTAGPSVSGTKTTVNIFIGGFQEGTWIGGEGDIGYTRNWTQTANYHTLTLSLLVGPRIHNLRPYGSIGYGTMGTVDSFTDIFKFGTSLAPAHPVLTYGGGLKYRLNNSAGLRFDVRVFRDPPHASDLTIGTTSFMVTRVAIGAFVMF